MNRPELLPSAEPAFRPFAALALPYQQLWRLPAGLALTGLLWVMLVVIVATALIYGFGWTLDPPPGAITSPGYTLMSIAAFVFVYPALWLSLRLLHRRGLTSLLGPNHRINWRQAAIAALVTLLIGGGSVVLSLLAGSALDNLPLGQWLVWLLPALVLLCFQVTAEELVFRGYVMQQLGARFASRWIWWVLPAVLFGLLHYDPYTFGPNALLVVAAAGILGLISGDLTVRTGNLGASIGLHFANNFVALLIMGLPGPLSGLTLYLADVDLDNIAEVRAGLLGQIGLLLVVYGLYVLVMAWLRKRQLQSAQGNLN